MPINYCNCAENTTLTECSTSRARRLYPRDRRWARQAVSVCMKDSLGVISTFLKHFAFIQWNFTMKFQWTLDGILRFNLQPKPKQQRKSQVKNIYTATQLIAYILNYKLMCFLFLNFFVGCFCCFSNCGQMKQKRRITFTSPWNFINCNGKTMRTEWIV